MSCLRTLRFSWAASILNSSGLFIALILAIQAGVQSAYPQTPPRLDVHITNGIPWLIVTGDVGSVYTIQAVTNLSKNWQFVTNFVLLSEQTVFGDQAQFAAQRFYRVFSQQVPTNIVGTNLVWISPRVFTMGSPHSELRRNDNEGPQTRVTITRGFWMGKYTVTQGEYAAIMGYNPSYFSEGNGYGPNLDRAVEQVSYYDALGYCARLTTRQRSDGRLPAGYVYRLPTEAEWEYACRAGTLTAFHYGTALQSGMANFNGHEEYDSLSGVIQNPTGVYLDQPTSVGGYVPNAWGLYDMHGNVWQWCLDWWSDHLPGGSVTDPQGPLFGEARVIRGGSWYAYAVDCRSAVRDHSCAICSANVVIGFRVVLAPEQ